MRLDSVARQRSSRTSSSVILAANPRRSHCLPDSSLAGLPTPELQFPIRTSTGTYYPDFYWPEHHLIGECDGMVKYTDPAALVAEKVREDSLRALGNRFVRWLGREVMATPGVVVGRVSRALGL